MAAVGAAADHVSCWALEVRCWVAKTAYGIPLLRRNRPYAAGRVEVVSDMARQSSTCTFYMTLQCPCVRPRPQPASHAADCSRNRLYIGCRVPRKAGGGGGGVDREEPRVCTTALFNRPLCPCKSLSGGGCACVCRSTRPQFHAQYPAAAPELEKKRLMHKGRQHGRGEGGGEGGAGTQDTAAGSRQYCGSDANGIEQSGLAMSDINVSLIQGQRRRCRAGLMDHFACSGDYSSG